MSAISKTNELIEKIEDESLFEILEPICIRKTVCRRAAFTAMSLFLVVAASPAFAQENSADTPSSKTSSAGTLEIFGGYVRYKDSCCEGDGFAIGIAPVLGLDREGGFRLGFRPEIAYHSANLGAQGIGVLLLAANVQIEAGSLKGPLVGFVYGGGGWMGTPSSAALRLPAAPYAPVAECAFTLPKTCTSPRKWPTFMRTTRRKPIRSASRAGLGPRSSAGPYAIPSSNFR